MVCSMVKKGLLGAALTAGGLFLVFGTSAPSYVRTAFHKMRHNAKDAVPVQFEIDRARDEIAALEPAIRDNIEMLARTEVEVKHLDDEITDNRAKLNEEKKAILAWADQLKRGDYRLAGHVPYTADEVKARLTHKWDHYRNFNKIVEDKEAALKHKQETVIAARKQLEDMVAQKRALLTKLEAIEAHLKTMEARGSNNEFEFDASALARAKATVSDLERRLEVMEHRSDMEGQFSDTGMPPSGDDGRDVVKEIETELGTPAPAPDSKAGNKSL